jgi:hypothetical protein
MPKPEDVRPAKFPDPIVVYDHDGFAVAAGHYDGDTDLVLAGRWNGEGDDPGYPKLFGNPTWFVFAKDLMLAILTGLLASRVEGSRPEAILRVLAEITAAR